MNKHLYTFLTECRMRLKDCICNPLFWGLASLYLLLLAKWEELSDWLEDALGKILIWESSIYLVIFGCIVAIYASIYIIKIVRRDYHIATSHLIIALFLFLYMFELKLMII